MFASCMSFIDGSFNVAAFAIVRFKLEECRDVFLRFDFFKMDMTLVVSSGMAVIALALLLLMQSQGLLASGFHIESTVCGADHIAYSNFLGHQLFYINGNLVDEDTFCKSLQHHTKDCVLRGYHRNLDLSLAGLAVKLDRKLLQDKKNENKFTSPDLGMDTPEENKTDPRMFSTYGKAGIAATGTIVMFCAFLCPCFYRKKKAAAHTVLEKNPSSMHSASSFDVNNASEVPQTPLRVPPSPSRFSTSPRLSRLGSVHLNLSQVVRATRNFSPALQIGEGGFGTVYKAHLEDGHVVAIKRAKKEFFESLLTEFSSEVALLAKIDHRNLVKLLGYVDKGNERLIITEYVPNGTLREHLDGQRGKILDFNQRLEIAIDVAHALTYLHSYAERQIIHRDVKSSNILLTENMRAKVADFGFARLGEESDRTHVSTKVKGTVGYLDPEYMKTYHLTPKSDVYSFGILLIEILTGRRPVEMKRPADERVTLRWAFRKYDEGALVDMVDPLMEEIVDAKILRKMFSLAMQCAAPVRADRPDMKSVAEQLWGIRADYLKRMEKRVAKGK